MSRAAIRHKDGARATALRCSNDRPEIVRVLHAVEQNENGFWSDFRQQVVCVGITRRRCDCEDALMIRVVSQPIKRNARLAANGNVGASCRLDDLAQPGVFRAFGDNDAVDTPPARAQGFKDRQNSIDGRHRSVCSLSLLQTQTRLNCPAVQQTSVKRPIKLPRVICGSEKRAPLLQCEMARSSLYSVVQTRSNGNTLGD